MYIKFYCKTSKLKKDGTAPIYFVLKQQGLEKLISSSKYIKPQFFDNEEGVVKKGDSNAQKLNAYLINQKKILNDIILDIENSDQKPTFDMVLARFRNDNHINFISFALDELNKKEGLISENNWNTTYYQIKKIERFKPGIGIANIDTDFLCQYEYYLRGIGNKTNSIAGDFRTLRKFYRIAIEKGYTKSNPFKNFRIKTEESNKEHLTISELDALQILFDGNLTPRLHITLYYFLRSCYTGLRLGDSRRYTAKDIVSDMLVTRMGKTKRIVRIPLNNRAKKLFTIEGEVRPLKISNSRINGDLMEIMKMAGIQKHITFHCSRHTFAINSLILNIPLKIISDVLGHTTIKTTEIYAKIVDAHKVQEMDKWNF